jgi:hypothetical protein
MYFFSNSPELLASFILNALGLTGQVTLDEGGLSRSSVTAENLEVVSTYFGA